MNPYICASRVPLLTYESGNNKYYDCSFTLRPTFRANSKGQYKITVNEALFNNTEPLINKDDHIDFIVETDSNLIFTYQILVKKDFYLYRQGGAEWQNIILLLTGKLGTKNSDYDYSYTKIVRTKKDSAGTETTIDDDSFTLTLKLINDDGTQFNGTNRGVNPLMYYDVSDITLPSGSGTITSVKIHYSWGFVYILNNSNNYISPITDENLKPSLPKDVLNWDNHYLFEFCNLRLGGAYFYVIDMPTVKTDVMTMNENNQCYNIVGCTRNTADNHNENVQFISSMMGDIDNLSNFRVRLLNDNFEPVRIRSPLYIQITISTAD